MPDSELIVHQIAPVFAADSRVLLLGSLPSPKSRAQGFYYGHPQNRFWPTLAAVLSVPPPEPADIEAKRRLLVEARQETQSLEKLKDIKRGEYDAAVAKAEEKEIDDLVMARRSAAVQEGAL